jgi:tetratricopeptide (TPR) repeat protein
VSGYQWLLANRHARLGTYGHFAGRFDAGEDSFRQAVATYEPLVREYPSNLRYALERAGCCCNLANLLRDSRLPASLEWYDEACAALEDILRQRRDAYAGRYLVNVLMGRALALTRLDRPADALRDWDRAIAQDTGELAGRLRCGRSLTLVRAGDLTTALAAANELATQTDMPRFGIYDLACVFALAAAQADDTRAAHAERAMALLARARESGHFGNEAERIRLAHDPYLDALRDRADFQKLLADLPGGTAAAPP